jgi:ubiquinone/menaquinone biosynthesis C-methylase UbiE
MVSEPNKHEHQVSNNLADTGERMVPSFHKGKLLYGEHIARYEAMRSFTKDKRVLDIASGSGYGTNILSKHAAFVTGVDYDADAIEYSKLNYASKNSEFKQGDATAIPMADKSVDVVISLETIEHIDDYEKFLSEIKRVLTDDGIAIISTPNDLESPDGNHFHVHEFDYHEALAAFKKQFKHVAPYFQGTWLYTALLDEKHLLSEWNDTVETLAVAPLKPETTMYYLFVCSNANEPKPLPKVGSIAEHWSVRRFMETEAAMRAHMEDQRKIMDHLTILLQIADAKNAKVQNSLIWKSYKKVRSIKRSIVPQKKDK